MDLIANMDLIDNMDLKYIRIADPHPLHHKHFHGSEIVMDLKYIRIAILILFTINNFVILRFSG